MSFLTFLLVAGFGSIPLELTAALTLDRPAQSIHWDQDGSLLIVDDSGEKIVVFNPNPQSFDTIALPQRIVPLLGIRSDQLFFYLYNEFNFYRLKKITTELEGPFPQPAANNLKIVDLDISATGEIFIADGYGDRIIVIDPLGTMRELGSGLISKPAGVRVTSTGDIGVVNTGHNRLTVLNRIGSRIGDFPLPSARASRLACDEKNRFYLLEINTNRIWRLAGGRFEPLAAGIPFAATALTVGAGRLFIIDTTTRLLVFDLPE